MERKQLAELKELKQSLIEEKEVGNVPNMPPIPESLPEGCSINEQGEIIREDASKKAK